MNVIGVYRSPRNARKKIEWNSLCKGIGKREGLIVVGDFNAHNTLWNCDTTDRIGEELMDSFTDESMYIVNQDIKSRLGEGNQTGSNLDFFKFSFFVFLFGKFI